MDPRIKRLVLPASLVVATLAGAGSCKSGTHGDEGGETYCIDIEQKAACNDAAACAWNDATSECENTCDQVTMETECVALERCEWSVAEGTTGGETCHEVFT